MDIENLEPASNSQREDARLRLRAFRDRQRAADLGQVQADIPRDLIEAIDRLKVERGVRGRTPIIEEALRLLIEKQQGP